MTILGWILLMLGCFFCIVGAIGLIRFPDFFTRVHAASIIDSLGAILILLGLITQTENLLIIFKILLILVFMMLTGPTAVHALARAALLAEKEED